jgi:hypothetical protein
MAVKTIVQCDLCLKEIGRGETFYRIRLTSSRHMSEASRHEEKFVSLKVWCGKCPPRIEKP